MPWHSPHVLPWHSSDLAAVGGSLVAMIFGVTTAATNEGATGKAGLVLAFAGLATAIGGVVVPLARLWVEERKSERDAKYQRHELANRLHLALLEIEDLRLRVGEHEAKIATNADTIDRVANESGVLPIVVVPPAEPKAQ